MMRYSVTLEPAASRIGAKRSSIFLRESRRHPWNQGTVASWYGGFSFMPKLSYSVVSFSRTDNAIVSPWGQAFSLLADVAAFPRKALTGSFFLRGLKVPEDDLIEAMNVADDALLRNPRARGIKDRCKAELNLLTRIEKAPMESRVRCELVWRILNEDSIEAIDETLKKKEAEVSPNFGDGSDQAAAV